MQNRDEVERVVEELREVLKQIFGILLDARQGFHHVVETTEKLQNKLLTEIVGATPATLDASPYMYNAGTPTHHPDDPSAPWLHKTTQGDLKQRNLSGGLNDVFIGNMCLVALFSYWEDHYRGQIAAALGKPRESILVPVFGDIRLIRNSIVHHRAIALPEIEKCEVLRWFSRDAAIAISTDQFRELARTVNQYLDDLLQGIRGGSA
jgi:hypothetical protein